MAMNPRLLRPRATGRLFLDQHRDARLAFSLRRLSSRYSGPVVRVRRSSDSAEQDFSAADVTGGALVAWVGAGNNGFVRTWYDQSGNNGHAQQATAAAQPKVVNSGSLCVNGKGFPTIFCDGGTYGLIITASAVFANDYFFAGVLEWTSNANSRVFAQVSGQGNTADLRGDFGNTRWGLFDGNAFIWQEGGLPQGANPMRLYGVRAINGSPGTKTLRRNGAIVATNANMANHTSAVSSGTQFALFSFSAASGPYAGNASELLFWMDSRPNTFQSIDDRLMREYNLP